MAQDTKTETHSPLPGRIVLIAILVTTIIGLAISIELSRIHHATHTDPQFHSICAINEKVNCEQVARSPYSVFLGVPISWWGTIAYSLLGLLSGWGLLSARLHRLWPRGILFFAFGAAIVASAILAHISFYIIDSMCLFCMGLYIVNSILMILGLVLIKTGKKNPFRVLLDDMKGLFGKPHLLGGLVLLTGALVASAMIFIPPYWHHIGWTDIPKLPTGKDKTGSHWVGAQEPVLTIYEYSDYECPHCRRAHKTARMMISKYPGLVRLVHKHMPIDNGCNPNVNRVFHQRACEFSKAVECAAAQNQFWEMNDALFSIQDNVPAKNVQLTEIIVQLGIDKRKFDQCMASDKPMEKVMRDLSEANNRNVTGTPTFFIGPQPYPGGIPESALKNAVKRAQKKQASNPN